MPSGAQLRTGNVTAQAWTVFNASTFQVEQSDPDYLLTTSAVRSYLQNDTSDSAECEIRWCRMDYSNATTKSLDVTNGPVILVLVAYEVSYRGVVKQFDEKNRK